MHLTRRQAIDFLKMDSKIFDNFFKRAGEFDALPRPNNRGFFYFDKSQLEEWKKGYDSRKYNLSKEEYGKCMDFALAIHFRGYVTSDWGTGRQREFGQKLSNWVRGQLGEIGVQHFCRERLGLEIELDFNMHDTIVPQDVLSITENGVKREPKNKIGVKASKTKSAYLVLSPNEVERDERRSDVYIFTRVDLPDDHLLRIAPEEVKTLVRNQQHYGLYQNDIPEFQPIAVEIAGFAYIDELDVVEEIPGQTFSGERYVKKSGELHRAISEWKEVFQ